LSGICLHFSCMISINVQHYTCNEIDISVYTNIYGRYLLWLHSEVVLLKMKKKAFVAAETRPIRRLVPVISLRG
jgi:hypothetical protein